MRRGGVRRGPCRGFTMIEMLTVIGIIMIVMALALPNFVQMMKGRKWAATVSSIQLMVMRARALATNVRKDMSVEFDMQGDNGTWMWLESEEQVLERIPDLDELQHRLGGGDAIYWIRSLWYSAGGSDKWGKYECVCRKCGHEWVQYVPPRTDYGFTGCPNCRDADTLSWPYWPSYETYYYDFRITGDPVVHRYGDNARQSEVVKLPYRMTIPMTIDVSGMAGENPNPNFVNWDSRDSVECYGYDDYRDIRIGPNGALVQTRDPVITVRHIDTGDFQQLKVVRCTGRLINRRIDN